MPDIIEKIEKSLFDVAMDYTPPQSEVKSVIHQWIHAIVTESSFFAGQRGITKETVIEILKKDKLYKDADSFKKSIKETIHIKPLGVDGGQFKFIDLFAGIGGMRQGFENAGGTCVFSSEFEKNAQQTYFNNFGEFPFGDITKISENDIPDHDVLVGGFPCQPFSNAGLKLGIDDTRGTLFYNIAKIIEAKRPRVVLLENVRGLISHDKGHTLKVVLTSLIDAGYKCTIDERIIKGSDIKLLKEEARSMVLKSKDFGVPQNRQRIFIVLWRSDLDVNFKYPMPLEVPTSVGDILEPEVAERYTISDRLWAGHQLRKNNNKKNGKGFGFGLVYPHSEYTNTISARYYKDGSEILVHQNDNNPRMVTPREAARLQGFPEEFLIHKANTQAYKQFGNSVTVPVINAVANNIKEILTPQI